jgi:hypothetical protein
MPLRTDIESYLNINAGHFQEFDKRKEVIQHLPKEWKLQAGDLMEWECGQFSGMARIVACEPAKGVSVRCVIQKLS